MNSPLPDLLDAEDLPEAVLRAAVLDGELYPVGPCYRPVDLPPDAAARASALRSTASQARVLAGRTAAWVWGAAADPGEPLSAFVPSTAAVGHTSPLLGASIRVVRLRASDVMRLDGVPLTTPLRTAIDLLCAAAPSPARADRLGVHALLAIAGATAEDLLADLATRSRLVGRDRAIALAEALRADAFGVAA
ncbi:MAG: hypothetical protein J7480_00945 [Microbacteriaceae bacterium]|nr:hypothetical protein [Microbacteriaceae bacterium]